MQKNWKTQFIVIYAGQAFSIVGSAATQFAIIWWLTEQTQSAITLTTASIIGFLPNIFLGAFAGVWIDRYNRRTVMMAADGFIALSSAGLALVFALGGNNAPVWLIYLVLFLRGLGTTFHGPAMQAAIPLLVPAEMLTKAGGWGNLINSVGNMAGPVLGAGLMAFLPLGTVMLVDVAGAAFAIFCLLFVKIPNVPQSAERPTVWQDVKQGFAALRGNRPLMAVFFPMILVNILFMPMGSLFPLLVLQHFGGTAWHNGVTEFFFAGGLLVSSIVIGVWGGMKRRFLMISLAVVVLGLACAVSGILPPAAFPVFVGMAFLMGNTGTFINVPLIAYTQQTIPADKLGKVLSLLTTAMMLAMPFGLVVAGPVSDAVGIDNWFFWSGIAMAFTGLLCWGMTRRFDKMPESREH